jgi:cell division septation protein DedD
MWIRWISADELMLGFVSLRAKRPGRNSSQSTPLALSVPAPIRHNRQRIFSIRARPMAQDYARHRDRNAARGGRRAATRMQPPASTHWNWYIAGVLSGLFAVFIGYVGIANFGGQAPGETPVQQVVVAEEDLPVFSFYQELANASVDVATPAGTAPPATTTAQTPPKQDNATAAKPTAAAATPTTAAATAPVETPPPATSPAATPPPATTVATAPASSDTRQYLLQAGSFQDRQDAESRRAKIILLNLNANVVPGVVAGRTWQRVQVGPFSGRQNAEAARALLSENQIDSIPLIVR